MPYRHAHYWLIALFPIIVLAFWPLYFSDIAGARPAQHAHAVTATAWLLLLVTQSWAAHHRQLAWHRAAGLALFAIVPLFAAAGTYAIWDMTVQMNNGHPFESFAAPALVQHDLSSIVALVGFVAAALVARRRMGRHAAWMISTALLVLAPITTRLIQLIPGLMGIKPPTFWMTYLFGQLITVALAIVVARLRPADARPFLVLIGLVALQIVAYRLLIHNQPWRMMLAGFGAGSPLPASLGMGVASLAALLLAWRAVPAKTAKRTQAVSP